MSDIKHTPWKVSLTDEITVIDSDNNDVVTISGDYETDYVEMAKRARLIGAAPFLLQALLGCCEHMEWSTQQGKEAYDDAMAAIRNALGSQS